MADSGEHEPPTPPIGPVNGYTKVEGPRSDPKTQTHSPVGLVGPRTNTTSWVVMGNDGVGAQAAVKGTDEAQMGAEETVGTDGGLKQWWKGAVSQTMTETGHEAPTVTEKGHKAHKSAMKVS